MRALAPFLHIRARRRHGCQSTEAARPTGSMMAMRLRDGYRQSPSSLSCVECSPERLPILRRVSGLIQRIPLASGPRAYCVPRCVRLLQAYFAPTEFSTSGASQSSKATTSIRLIPKIARLPVGVCTHCPGYTIVPSLYLPALIGPLAASYAEPRLPARRCRPLIAARFEANHRM